MPILIVGFILFIIAALAALVTHVVACVKAAAWLLLIAGGIVPFIGVAHGVATWLGYAWV